MHALFPYKTKETFRTSWYERETKSVKCQDVYLNETKSYVIGQNNIKEKTSCVYYFLIKRKKLLKRANKYRVRYCFNERYALTPVDENRRVAFFEPCDRQTRDDVSLFVPTLSHFPFTYLAWKIMREARLRVRGSIPTSKYQSQY